MLADYLEYARAGGVHVAAAGYPQGAGQSPDGDAAGYHADGRGDAGAFQADVAARLTELGITVVPQFGVGGYRVDFAAAHPDDPSRMILAIEADGAGYRADGSGEAGAFHADVAARLAELGITVVPQYGVGGYRVDFAAAHPDDPSRMILAIEADGAGYRDSGSVRDRDRLRKEHLERLGWRVHRLWSTAWFTDSAGELAKLRAAFDSAVGAAPPPPPEPAAEPTAASEPEGKAGPDGQAGPNGKPGPVVQPAPDGQGPGSEPPPAAGEERWPLSVPGTEAIPLGPGQRPRLSAPARRALPAAPAVGAAALSPGSGSDSR